MASRWPSRESNFERNCTASRLLQPLENLTLLNHERIEFLFLDANQNIETSNNVGYHVASSLTPPSRKLDVLPNAPLRQRKVFSKKYLRPRKLFHNENQQDTHDYEMASEEKEKSPLPQRKLDTNESALKPLKLSDKENQENGGGRPRNVAKAGGEKKSSGTSHPSDPKPERYSKAEFVYLRI